MTIAEIINKTNKDWLNIINNATSEYSEDEKIEILNKLFEEN